MERKKEKIKDNGEELKGDIEKLKKIKDNVAFINEAKELFTKYKDDENKAGEIFQECEFIYLHGLINYKDLGELKEFSYKEQGF